jgi:heme-degrading monooxygenase HmoA
MYIKWIVCKINKDNKEAFSNAQKQWLKSSDAEGFIAQAGGWDLNNDGTACIIAFWQSKEHLDNFMIELHDEIYDASRQAETYEPLEISHFNSLLTIESKSSSITEAIKKGRLLRIADSHIKPIRLDHFEKAQKKVMLPGMKGSDGMLEGNFSKAADDSPRYLVSTFWDSIEHHSYFANNRLPNFRLQANVSKDVTDTVTRKVLLVESWKIIT